MGGAKALPDFFRLGLKDNQENIFKSFPPGDRKSLF